MNAILDLLGWVGRPLILAAVFIGVLGLLSDHSGTGTASAPGSECKGFTDDPEFNRLWCTYHPARLWNMPVGELIPWLGEDAA